MSQAALDAAPHGLDATRLLDFYEQMVAIRYFEENAIDAFKRGLFAGSTHPCICQEAIAVGCAGALEPDDCVFATYRGHGHAIAKGCDPAQMMAELLCRETGCCKGRGGSMHLCDVSRNFWGTNAIVAAHIPIATGMALANKLRANHRVTMVYFGDGATCEGAFYEALNMAVLWELPIVFVCENNGIAISVPISQAIPLPNVSDRAAGFGLPGVTVDGNDVLAVYEAAREAVNRARAGKGPTLLECKTVRWERHSAFPSGKATDEAKVRAWKTADPIPRCGSLLKAHGHPEGELEERRARAEAIMRDALEFAIQSPLPNPARVGDDLFA